MYSLLWPIINLVIAANASAQSSPDCPNDMASTDSADHIKNEHDVVRQLADFPENIWADRFASFTFDKLEHEMCAEEIEQLKEEVRRMLLSTENDIMEKLDLIDKVERLGISYHFENEIEQQLQKIFYLSVNFEADPKFDLYFAALHFRLLRQHGFNISCGIFYEFMDANDKFKESLKSDTRGLLSLFEATHVRTQQDNILEEALTFAVTHLRCGAPHMDPFLAKQVEYALELPLHKSILRYEARRYISIYEEDDSNNKVLLRLAKLDYNLLQMLHKQELAEILRWGKELNIASKIRYARERYMECYFWAVGVFFEPQYSLARIYFAKIVQFVGIIDDTYDAYGTLDELKIFTEALEKWDGSGIDQLPEYMKTSFMELLNFNKELEKVLANDGRTYAFDKYIEEWKNYMRTSYKQSQWFLNNELPAFPDYLSNGLVTSTYYLLTAAAYLVMKSATKDVIDWMSNNPKLRVALSTHARLINDIGSYKFESTRGTGTAIECYMMDYNVSEEEAVKKFEDICADAWKDMNEECLRPTIVPREILMRNLNLARICEVVYRNRGDGFTDPHKIEAHIIAMLVEPLPV